MLFQHLFFKKERISKLSRFRNNIASILSILVFTLKLNISFLGAEVDTETAINPIKIGMSASLTGSAAEYGIRLRDGVKAYFGRVNDLGGINGRKIEFIVLDDAYIPTRAAANVHQLIDKNNVLALIGNDGTPSILVTLPILEQDKTVLFAPYASADNILRKTPPNPYIFNFRPSNYEEVNSLIKGALSIGIKPEQLAFFSQNDAFGDIVYKNAMKVLKEVGVQNPESLPYGRYERNTKNIEGALGTIMRQSRLSNTPFKAVLLGGIQDSNLKFIDFTKKSFPNTLFLIISVGILTVDEEAKNILRDTRFVLNEVVPDPYSDFQVVQEYREDLKKYIAENPSPSFISLESYLAAKLFTEGLKKASEENNLSREGIQKALESLKNIDFGIGIKISFDKDNHNAPGKIWPFTLKDGKLVSVDWEEIKLMQEAK
jgi:branched-chain amino acid transport system substrate-binding protein